MGKKLKITPQITEALRASTKDPEFDPSSVSVFECVAFNTLPINKRGLFSGARASESLLHEMANYVSKLGDDVVPMHSNHDQGYDLPVGRVFAAQVVTNEKGLPDLNVMFYLSNSEAKLVEKVDTSSIEEVSVGVASTHLNCSACGFDYLGPDSSSDNIYGLECGNGHKIGEDGTHVILNGLQRWMELSLVSLGAAKNAKILSRTKSLLGAQAYETLAATGRAPEATVLFANLPLTNKPESKKMDIKDLVELNAGLSGKVAVADHKVVELTAAVTNVTKERDELRTKLAEVEVKLTAATSATSPTVTELAAAKTEMAAQLAFVRTEADRLAVASGASKLPEAATFAELTASIAECRKNLTESFGKAAPVTKAGAVSLNASAFKQKR